MKWTTKRQQFCRDVFSVAKLFGARRAHRCWTFWNYDNRNGKNVRFGRWRLRLRGRICGRESRTWPRDGLAAGSAERCHVDDVAQKKTAMTLAIAVVRTIYAATGLGQFPHE